MQANRRNVYVDNSFSKLYTSINVLSPRLISVLSLLIFWVIQPVNAQGAAHCDSSALPTTAQELLTKTYPQWRVKVLSDLSAEDQQLWLSSAQSKACPGLLAGHFEAAEIISYALLLVPKSSTSAAGYKVVVLSKQSNDSSYAWKVVDHAEALFADELVIAKVVPGKYPNWDDSKSVNLKLDSILVEWMEKGASLYYWSAGEYRSIQTSD